MLRARSARSALVDGVPGGGTLAWRGKVAGRMAGSLMIRSIERSERIYNAMLARGYQGQMRVMQEPKIESRDFLVLSVGLLSLATLLVAVYL
jgi:cobalt/nickel transport system permease protein